MESVFSDIRYAIRNLIHRPGFTAIAVITLALGIGANSAIFSVVNAVLLRPMPYAEAERLIVPWGSKGDMRYQTIVSYPDFVDWQAQTQTLEYVAAYTSAGMLLREGDSEPEAIAGSAVSADLFPLLKITPALGHPFTRADDQQNAPPVIVIGYNLWQRRLNSDPESIGRTINLNDKVYTIVGVMPPGFRLFRAVDVWPIMQVNPPKRRGPYGLRLIAKLKPGIDEAQAGSELTALRDQVEREWPNPENPGGMPKWSYEAQPLKEFITGKLRSVETIAFH